MKLSKKRYVSTQTGTFERVMETREFIYYMNFSECDENAAVKMYNRKRELISDNYFAFESFFDAISDENEHKVWWMSEKLKKQLSQKKVIK